MTETVVGLDPVATGVSVVVAASDGVNPPRIGGQFVPSPPLAGTAPADFVARMTAVSQRVVDALVGAALKPSLAVMMKPTLGPPNRDRSWDRRVQLAGDIERLLVAHGVPVAEIPPMTVTKWVLGPESGVRARRGFEQVEAEIKRLYPAAVEPSEHFRVTTIGAAAAALVAAGLPTGHQLTVFDTNTLEAMSLPRGWRLPDLRAKALKRAVKEKELT